MSLSPHEPWLDALEEYPFTQQINLDPANECDFKEYIDLTYHKLNTIIKDGDYEVRNIYDSKDINIIVRSFGYINPPHHPMYAVREIITTKETENLVRVFQFSKSEAAGYFLMPISEINGLTTKEIQAKVALNYEPTHIVDAKIPANVRMFVGVAEENFGQPGGSIQFQLVEEISIEQKNIWFANIRELK